MKNARSGLRAQQTKIEVIGHNIANVDTPGFKASDVQFSTLFGQAISHGSAPTAGVAGIDPVQVGGGVRVAGTRADFRDGPIEATGRATDIAIQGSGFFVLADDRGGRVFTRDGAFATDGNQQLVDPGTGFAVQGYTADQDFRVPVGGAIGDIEIAVGTQTVARATSRVELSGNLDPATPAGATEGAESEPTLLLTVYDSLGAPHDARLTFKRESSVSGGPTTWRYSVEPIQAEPIQTEPIQTESATPQTLTPQQWQVGARVSGGGTLEFDSDGHYRAPTGDAPEIVFDLSAAPGGGAVTPLAVQLDFAQVTQFAGFDSGLQVVAQDGLEAGALRDYFVGTQGQVEGVFTNGETRTLGQLVLAEFANPNGLAAVGDSFYRASVNSGRAQIGIPGTFGRGVVQGGALEGSNVDLAVEFTELIVAQRAFQANARVFTVADELLQELLDLI